MGRQKGRRPFGRTSGRPQGEGQCPESNFSSDKKAGQPFGSTKCTHRVRAMDGPNQMGRRGVEACRPRVLQVTQQLIFLLRFIALYNMLRKAVFYDCLH